MTKAPPVTARLDVDVDDHDVAFFREEGYLTLGRITTDEEVEWLREIFDELFARRAGGFPGGFFDLTRPYDSPGDDQFAQALLPELALPELRDTQYVRNGKRIASRLLGVPEGELHNWGHMLNKPARIGDEAPWHQDEAYWDVHLDYHAVGAWVPLDDAVVENGCLWFLPRSHLGEVLPHRHRGDDPSVHILELVEPVDTSAAVAVPMRAGEVSFHHPRTLHHSEPNTTDHARRAYANEFQTAPIRRAEPADRPWVVEGRAAFDARATFRSA